MNFFRPNGIDKELCDDFYQFKFERFRIVGIGVGVFTVLTNILCLLSDHKIFNAAPRLTLVPRLTSLIPLILLLQVNKRTKNYKVINVFMYILCHFSVFSAMWAISLLPDRTVIHEATIIVHLSFLGMSTATPFINSFPMHALLFVTFAITRKIFGLYECDLFLSSITFIGISLYCKVLEDAYVDLFRNRLYLKTRNERLTEKTDHLEEISTKDNLTKVFNRTKFEFMVASGTEQLKMNDSDNIYFIMIDVDDFKKVNDTYGHDAGDKVLEYVANTISSCVREHDYVFRWGGEEFVVLCSDSSEVVAKNVAERIRKHIESGDPGVCPVTASIGVAKYDKVSYIDTVNRADKALYFAKSSGKNVVKFYDEKMDENKGTD